MYVNSFKNHVFYENCNFTGDNIVTCRFLLTNALFVKVSAMQKYTYSKAVFIQNVG